LAQACRKPSFFGNSGALGVAMFDAPDVEEVSVILVPPEQRRSFSQTVEDYIRVHGADGSTWVRPQQHELQNLLTFITRHEDRAFWSPHVGTRIGYDSCGVFVHQDHCKRYFGIVRAHASIVLRAEVPPAVPTIATQVGRGSQKPTERLLRGMLAGIEKIEKNVRDDVLRAAFRGVDKNNNGTLDKAEMVNLMRRIMPTMSGKQVVSLMEAADTNGNSVVDYDEFVKWIETAAPKDMRDRFENEMNSEYDCVRAVFRLWDRNGDGIITKKELSSVLRKTCPDMTANQVEILILNMDKNKDSKIDYDEFLEFIFGAN